MSHRHPWGTPSLPRTQLWGLGGPLNPQGSQSHSTFSSQIQKHIHIKLVSSFSRYQKKTNFYSRKTGDALFDTAVCSTRTRLDRWGWGFSRPCPWGKGAVRNPGSSRRHRQRGSPERASAWCEAATVPAELSMDVWPVQTKTHILIFFGFESFKPKFKF